MSLKAVVMAGGKGTRLRPLTSDCPKPMVPVANRPMLEHIIILLKEHGFDEIILTTCYLPDQFTNSLRDGRQYGVSIHYSHEEEPMGTAGGVRRLADLLDDTFLVISGDCLTDINLSQALQSHKQKKAEATIVVTEVDDPTQYGIVTVAMDGRIRRFLEKPDPTQVFSKIVNTGIYVLEPSVLQMVPPSVAWDFSRNLFPEMLSNNRRLFAHIGRGYWSDIGSCRQYIRAQADVLYGKVRLPSLDQWEDQPLRIHEDAWVEQGAEIVPPVMLGPGTVVSSGARVGPAAVIGAGSRVMSGAVVEHSVLWEGSHVGTHAVVKGAAVGRGGVVEQGASLLEGATLGHGERLTQDEVVAGVGGDFR